MLKIEYVTEKLCEYLNDAVYDMLMSVEEEKYEAAEIFRKDIERKIKQVQSLIINKHLTTMSKDELREQLVEVRNTYIKIWSEYLKVPQERVYVE